ncbi:hypothetical protein V498_01762 [Pseudogymnoascus sp. VKM F-4517 (FW-2822)]|nr:hypothetical protein V498_01762 [Pseudogymnoascus sp. VKM F-4517 (FW-2822)]
MPPSGSGECGMCLGRADTAHGRKLLSGSVLNYAQLKTSANELEKLNVKIVNSTRVTSAKNLPSGRTELTLSTSDTMLTDLYHPTVGLLTNSGFVPKSFINEKGQVVADEFLRVKSTEDIWAVGDVSNIERSGVLIAQAQAIHLVENLELVLQTAIINLTKFLLHTTEDGENLCPDSYQAQQAQLEAFHVFASGTRVQ